MLRAVRGLAGGIGPLGAIETGELILASRLFSMGRTMRELRGKAGDWGEASFGAGEHSSHPCRKGMRHCQDALLLSSSQSKNPKLLRKR